MATANPLAHDQKQRIETLVYYSVDKASPYALAYGATTDSLEKIVKFKLTELAITSQGASIMWLWINAHCHPDAAPVAPDVAMKCKTVADVNNAVMANAR